MEDVSWFDRKYDDGKKPSLADKSMLFAQSVGDTKLNVPDRAKLRLEETIKMLLFEMKRDYRPGIEALAHGYIFCLAPVLGIDEKKISEYMARYGELAARHADKSPFARNFGNEQA